MSLWVPVFVWHFLSIIMLNYRLWRHRSARLSGENTIFANFAALSARRLRRHLQVFGECELQAATNCKFAPSLRDLRLLQRRKQAPRTGKARTADFGLRRSVIASRRG